MASQEKCRDWLLGLDATKLCIMCALSASLSKPVTAMCSAI